MTPCLLHLPFYLNLSAQIWQELSFLFCSIKVQWVPGHSFLPGNNAADELARREATRSATHTLCNPLWSPLISHIHCCLFSDWRRIVSSKFFDTQVSSISTEKLVLPRHARCVLSRLCCNGHSLLLSSYLSRIGRNENLSCSVCGHPSLSSHSALSSYGFFASLALWRLSTSLRPLVQVQRNFPEMPPSVGRDRVTTTTFK